MIKKTVLIFTFLVGSHSQAMEMAARPSELTMTEAGAQQLIHHLLGKTYSQIVSILSKLNETNKECVKKLLEKQLPPVINVQLLQTIPGHTYGPVSMAFSPDGRRALIGSFQTFQLLDLTQSPITTQQIAGHQDWIETIVFSTDSRLALTCSWDYTARVWDLTSSPITSRLLEGHTGPVDVGAFSSDGRYALTGSSDHTARLWDLSQAPITSQILAEHEERITSVGFSHDERFALTGSDDKRVIMWDLWKAAHGHITTPYARLVSLGYTTFPCDSPRRIMLSKERDCALWNFSDPDRIVQYPLVGHTKKLEAIACSKDKRFVLTAAADKTVCLWDLTQNQARRQLLVGHADSVSSVAFSPNGRFALTGSYDKTARLWDLSQSPITSQELPGHSDRVTTVAFSPDGRFAFTGSGDQMVRIWQISPAVSSALSIEDSMLLLKARKNEDSLKDDIQALERLKVISEQSLGQQSQIGNIVETILYKKNLPEQDCYICTESYNPYSKACMELPCCKKLICKACLDQLGSMTYSTTVAGYQFQHAVQAKCPFCNKPATQMGTVKKFDTDKNGGTHS